MAKKKQTPMERYLCIAIIIGGAIGLYTQNEVIKQNNQTIHEQGTEIGKLREELDSVKTFIGSYVMGRQ